ncbi:MAG TPA: FliM/FliN family flagellar motor switch protein, partial [Acidimicrobiales bacterium]|nr:FliM/FliN family flagellar motor switch protein [Acidimicrobiales bacterium]
RILSALFDAICHRFASAATAEVRQAVHVDITDTDQITWESFSTAIPEVTTLSYARLSELDARVALHVRAATALEVLDFYFGGDGAAVAKRDGLTELEREVLAGVITESFWKALPGAFTIVRDGVAAESVIFGTNAIAQQLIRPNEMCLVIRMTLRVNDRGAHPFEMIFPIDAIEPTVVELEHAQFSHYGRGGGTTEAADRLEQMPIDVRISFPPIELTAAEVGTLEVGHVLKLNNSRERPPIHFFVVTERIATGQIVSDETPTTCQIATTEVVQ